MRIILALLLLCSSCFGANLRLDDVRVDDVKLRGDTYTDYTQDANCVGAWRFNEDTADTVIDTSGKDGHSTTISNVSYVLGKEGNAWSGNGSSSYIYLADNANTNPQSAFSVAHWIYLDSATDERIIFDSRNSNHGFMLEIAFSTQNYNFVTKWSGTSYYLWTDDNAISVGEWTHIVVTCDKFNSVNTTKKIYINGVESKSTSTAVYYSGSTPTLFNRSGTKNLGFAGDIDEFVIFNRVLTDSEILDIYNNGLK